MIFLKIFLIALLLCGTVGKIGKNGIISIMGTLVSHGSDKRIPLILRLLRDDRALWNMRDIPFCILYEWLRLQSSLSTRERIRMDGLEGLIIPPERIFLKHATGKKRSSIERIFPHSIYNACTCDNFSSRIFDNFFHFYECWSFCYHIFTKDNLFSIESIMS